MIFQYLLESYDQCKNMLNIQERWNRKPQGLPSSLKEVQEAEVLYINSNLSLHPEGWRVVQHIKLFPNLMSPKSFIFSFFNAFFYLFILSSHSLRTNLYQLSYELGFNNGGNSSCFQRIYIYWNQMFKTHYLTWKKAREAGLGSGVRKIKIQDAIRYPCRNYML